MSKNRAANSCLQGIPLNQETVAKGSSGEHLQILGDSFGFICTAPMQNSHFKALKQA